MLAGAYSWHVRQEECAGKWTAYMHVDVRARARRTFALSDDAAHCVSLHKQPPQHPCRLQNSMGVDGAAARTAAACSRSMASTPATSAARLGRPCLLGATGPERPKSPGNAPQASFLPAVGSCSMYMCNYSAAYWLTLRLALMLTVTWPFPGFYLSLWQISSGKFHFRTGKFQ